jgi:hypothetical protein
MVRAPPVPVLEYAPRFHKMRQKRGLRRRSPKFLNSNLNLIFIIAALGAAAQASSRVVRASRFARERRSFA